MGAPLVRIGQVVLIVSAAAFAYSFAAAARDAELRRACIGLCALAPAYVGDDRLAPEIELRDLQGSPARLSELRGRTVLLVFWSTTCDSCKEELPALASLAEAIEGDNRLALLTVAVDDSAQVVRDALRAHTGREDPFHVLLDSESVYVRGRYGTRKFPETWVVDEDGVIRARFDGPRDWSSGIATDLLRTIAQGSTCPMTVQGQEAWGLGAKVCEESR